MNGAGDAAAAAAVDRAGEPEWTMVVRPHAGWLDLRLADLRNYRDLVYLFVKRDFVAQYKQTILGPAWFVLQPLLTTVMFTVVFGNIARLSTDGLPKPLFYMCGTVLWGFYQNCLMDTSYTFLGNSGIFGKVYFPRLVVPISVLISQLLRYLLQFAFFLAFVAYFALRGAEFRPSWMLAAVPLLLALTACNAFGVGIIISSLTTKYRDLRFLLGFAVNLFMYATPVIYPLSSLQGRYRDLSLANPLTALFEAYRYAFFSVGEVNPAALCYSAAATLVIAFAGLVLFARVERTFMDTI